MAPRALTSEIVQMALGYRCFLPESIVDVGSSGLTSADASVPPLCVSFTFTTARASQSSIPKNSSLDVAEWISFHEVATYASQNARHSRHHSLYCGSRYKAQLDRRGCIANISTRYRRKLSAQVPKYRVYLPSRDESIAKSGANEQVGCSSYLCHFQSCIQWRTCIVENPIRYAEESTACS